MGTHGRNAITLKGIHTCHEQSMDGHYAANDMTDPFLLEGKIPIFDSPTMEDQTDECQQESFAHIDYDTKILYTSQVDPRDYLKNKPIKEQQVRKALNIFEFDREKIGDGYGNIGQIEHNFGTILMNLYKLRELGWKVYFNAFKCPASVKCVNS